MFWVTKILGWVAGDGLNSIATEIRKAHADRLAAKNDAERLKSEERMDTALRRVEAQNQGPGAFWAKVMRASFAIPIVLYNAKIVVWDKIMGYGATDPLGGYMETVAWIVIGFYFLDNSVRLARRGA